MPRITALRELRGGRVAVALDGQPWRTLPLDAVVHAGLAVGCELDRGRARELARARRGHAAMRVAAAELRRRDLATRGLAERLERRGVAPAARTQALDALAAAGYVDDARFAETRAAALAARGYGDAAIRWRLEHEGVDPPLVTAACGALEPERERAARIVAARGMTAATARLLTRRGFAEDAVEAVVALEP